MSLHLPRVSARELRRTPRLDYQRRAWCEHGQLTLYLCLANLSRGGMFVQTATPLSPGQRLKVSIVDAQPAIVIETEIVWSLRRGRSGGVGCRIVSFAEGAESYLGLLDRLLHGEH